MSENENESVTNCLLVPLCVQTFCRINDVNMETKSKRVHAQGPEEFETFKFAQFAN